MADVINTIVVATTKTVTQGFVPTVKLPPTVPAVVILVHHDEKLEKFNGLNFKR